MRVLFLSDQSAEGHPVAAVLELLGHQVTGERLGPASAAVSADDADLALVDATGDLARASMACRALAAAARLPVLVVADEGALATLKPSWGLEDWLLPSAQPAEVETRLRLAWERQRERGGAPPSSVGDLSIDEDSYVVRLRGRPLDLTYREFELLKHLARHPGLVLTRGQLLKEVWGYDYFGGTRTVDVHIRRLRAKLGAEHEQLIVTVRGVGYKLDPHGTPGMREAEQAPGMREADQADGGISEA